MEGRKVYIEPEAKVAVFSLSDVMTVSTENYQEWEWYDSEEGWQ